VNDLAILDPTRLELITRGDTALANDFLGTLFEEAGTLTERLSGLAGDGDRTAVADIAHTIKGMAAEVGAKRLQAVAAMLESEPVPEKWPEHLDQVQAALAELRQHVRERI
jgi:HPt (histidine-containing phosphotransfer) domain-containing protein